MGNLNHSEVAHRWVHGKFDKYGYVSGNSMSGNELNLYSYSTVIAQALDREREVFLVIDETLTTSTSKHVCRALAALPSSAKVIRTHFVSSSSYDNVDFLSMGQKFDKTARLHLVTHLLSNIYSQYNYIRHADTLRAERISKGILAQIDTLANTYGDCSLSCWLRSVTERKSGLRNTGLFRKYKKMVRMMVDGKNDEEIADGLFGAGTWAAFQKRVAPLKKAADTRRKMEALKAHLLYKPEHGYHWDDHRSYCPYNAKELRRLTPRQILDIRFSNLAIIEEDEKIRRKYGYGWDAPSNEKTASRKRAYKFLGIEHSYNDVDSVTDNNGKIVYKKNSYPFFDRVTDAYIRYGIDSWNCDRLYFTESDYEKFCASTDKHEWRRRWWQLAALKQRRLDGSYLFYLREAYERKGLAFEMSEEQNHIYNEFVVRYNQREDIERRKNKKLEAERLRHLQEKLEQIAAYKESGYPGIRRLWIERLESIPADILFSPELCYGGNILLRFASQDGYVETSKNIRIPFKDCHSYWEIIKGWHDGTIPFEKGVEMAGYHVKSYENDILTAGCHEIAFCEMERMYNELCAREAV